MARPRNPKKPAASVAAPAAATEGTAEDAAATSASSEGPANDVDTDLVTMTKGGETLDVHRTCVADHKRVGWAVVE